jgi:hypothetical protein
MTLWVPHPEHGKLVYQGGQALPEPVLDAIEAGAVMVPGPPGVLELVEPAAARVEPAAARAVPPKGRQAPPKEKS